MHTGTLHPLSPTYLQTILELLLNTLVSLGIPHTAAPIDEVVDALAGEHEVPRSVSTQVLGWFGEVVREGVGGGRWKMDVQSVVREVGLGILRNYKVRGLEVRW